jgi:hypothetical protein
MNPGQPPASPERDQDRALTMRNRAGKHGYRACREVSGP